jgi:hypothetical protein
MWQQMKKTVLALAVLLACGQAWSQKPSYSLRLDYHYGSLNPWLFYEVPIDKNLGWLSVFQMSSLGFAQIDVGPNFHLGRLQLIPQVGFEFSETRHHSAEMSHVVPEFYAIYYGDKIAFESWNLYFVKTTENQVSYYYYRDFLLFRVAPRMFMGPQMEGYAYAGTRASKYLGGQINLDIGIGSIALYMGRDGQIENNIFRMTFVRNF